MEDGAGSRPERFDLIGELLAVRWSDGHESFYEPAGLRAHCPCAICKVRREKPPEKDPLKVISPAEEQSAGAKIIGLEPVGRYALRLHWSDRHDNGIYDFRTLRRLCPCEACREKGSRP